MPRFAANVSTMYGEHPFLARFDAAARDGFAAVECQFPYEAAAAEVFGRWMLGADTGDLLETNTTDRERIFDLGYYTWVEQRGVSVEDFVVRREPAFWTGLRSQLEAWDELIADFNARTGVAAGVGAR